MTVIPNSERPSGYILGIIGLDGTQCIQVCYWPDRDIFHATCTGREDSSLERLIETVHEHWNDVVDDPDPEGRMYQAQYAYACGYYD